MNSIEIIEKQDKKTHQWLQARVGKTEGSVFVSPFAVTVCNTSNASHKAWRKQGRRFKSLLQAREAYKSKAMKSIIEEAIKSFSVTEGTK